MPVDPMLSEGQPMKSHIFVLNKLSNVNGLTGSQVGNYKLLTCVNKWIYRVGI